MQKLLEEKITRRGLYHLFQKNAEDLYPGRYTQEYVQQLIELKDEAVHLLQTKRILLLAHNYQFPEIQELAWQSQGYVGDSYGLTLKAKESKFETVLYSTVEFMAQTGKILLPDKRILLPARPGCSLVDGINHDFIRTWKVKHQTGIVVSYINTDPETKALSDYICTSRNAPAVVAYVRNNHPGSRILFLPDKYLAAHVMRELKMNPEEMDIWDGACHVHKAISEQTINEALDRYPDAELLIHPECGCTSSCLSRCVSGNSAKINFLSTEGMITQAKASGSKEFVVATEKGIVYRLRREIPEKKFYPVSPDANCEYMKMITLEKIVACLRDDQNPLFEVNVDPVIANKARKAIERMMAIN